MLRESARLLTASHETYNYLHGSMEPLDPQTACVIIGDEREVRVALETSELGLLATGPTGEQLSIDAPVVMAIDTTGAGDSLAAGLLASLADGYDVASALATGVRVASTVVGRDSHRRYPTRQELLSL